MQTIAPATAKVFAKVLVNICFLFLVSFFLVSHLSNSSPTPLLRLTISSHTPKNVVGCKGLQRLPDAESKCAYLNDSRNRKSCVPQGFIDYLYLFYCTYADYTILGYFLLSLWLILLFYVSGTTASNYFCPSLEGLSSVLRLPPTVAGVTLLSLGNGAPDVFASVVSFTGSGVVQVGLGSVLGGTFFVSTVVVAAISFAVVGRPSARLHRPSFIRDGFFLLGALVVLLFILAYGRVGISGSVCFTSLYAIYVIIVATALRFEGKGDNQLDAPLLEVENIEIQIQSSGEDDLRDDGIRYPKLSYFVYLLELPLEVPRRLTIPMIREEKWSKPFATAAAIFGPLLLATIWNYRLLHGHSNTDDDASSHVSTLYMCSSLLGALLAVVVWETTESSTPPRKCMLPWLAAGFLMSVAWSYITASELVAVLVSFGYISGVSPSILGLTVLSWGNSLGDLIANVAIAINGGRHGAQIAMSGCYAGPTFNILVGLGFSLVLSSWATRPSSFVIPWDDSFGQTLAFQMCAVLWALVWLPMRGMKLGCKVFGGGLLLIYACFLCSRLVQLEEEQT